MTISTRSVDSPAGPFTALDVDCEGFRVGLLSLGAAIHYVQMTNRAGMPHDVHLRLPAAEDYADRLRNPHLGASLGRYANRIAGARFTLDGVDYRLDANDGPNTLHGGSDGFDRRVWRTAAVEDHAVGARVTFALTSPDGDMGFPGRVEATVTYDIQPGRIAITSSATSDAPTVVSLANHGYWNLAGSDSIATHTLQVHGSQRLVPDATQIPCAIASVSGTAYDLLRPVPLGPAIDETGGIDDCYVIDGTDMRAAAVLHDPASGRRMRVSTDAPGLQVYTGNSLRTPFVLHQSVSLEAQRMPDAPNQPELGPCLLLPGEHYQTVTVLEFDFTV